MFCLSLFIKIISRYSITFQLFSNTKDYLIFNSDAIISSDNYNFMKKKIEQKKEIVPIFQPALFWEYQPYPQQALDKLDAFLASFSAELKALIMPDRSLEQNYETLCEKVGCNSHPSLARRQKEQSQFPNLRNNDYGERFAIFLNHRIDSLTLRLFSFLLQHYKLNSIKFSNNCLQGQAEEVRRLLDREDQLTTLYFQWNPLLEHPSRQEVFLACARPSLQHLILRQCHIGNNLAKELIKKIRAVPEGRLKSLDLYGNDLTGDIIEDVSCLVEESKTLEFFGISKNNFSTQQALARLFGSIGQIPLSQQEYQQHKLKQKARDEVVERNKKRKKGAPEQPVPFVFEVKDTANGKCYVKNTTLKILNLASNGIKDNVGGVVRKFIEGNGRNVQLFIEGNKFSKTMKETLKFYQKVIS